MTFARGPQGLLGIQVTAAVNMAPLKGFSTVREEIDGRLHGETFDAGVSLVADLDGTIRTVQLHSGDSGQYRPHIGELPGQLRFDCDRATVRRMLGTPTKFRESVRRRHP